MPALSPDTVAQILDAIGVAGDFETDAFRALPAEWRRAALDAAARYREVIDANLARSFPAPPPDDALTQIRIRSRPGAKSALFRRLLEGKSALSEPPPTSFSYPWFDLVDKPGPHPVTLNAVASGAALGSEARGDRHLLINQCLWAVTWSTADTADYLEASRRYFAARDARDLATQHAALNECQELAPTVQWGVRHGTWPLHRVYFGASPALQVGFRGSAGEFDPAQGGGQITVVRVIKTAQQVRQEAEDKLQRAREERDQGVTAEAFATIGERIAFKARQSALRHEDPSVHAPYDDLIEYRTVGWLIERVNE
jgi:hypothetical protein